MASRNLAYTRYLLACILTLCTQFVATWYYFGRCSFELAQLVLLPVLVGGLFVVLIDCMIFLSSFLDVRRMLMSTVLKSSLRFNKKPMNLLTIM